MLHAGLDLSRHRLDVCLLDAQGSTVQVTAAPPDADGLRGLASQTAAHGQPVRAATESMNGARFVHDQLELAGWQVASPTPRRSRAWRRLPVRPTGSTPGCSPELSRRDLVPEIWLPPLGCGPNENGHGSGCTFTATGPRSRTASTPPCWPSASRARSATCFGAGGRQLLARLTCPSRGSATSPRPWRSSTTWTTGSTAANGAAAAGG
jgi:hypothetical protein